MAAAHEVPMHGLSTLAEFSIGDGRSVEDICAAIAKVFGVRQHEVALLYIDRRMLRFLYPVELKAAGAIPLTSTAVAARTANSRRPELFNNFVNVQHSSIFESVKLGTSENSSDPLTIQKMMSAPVVAQNRSMLGVIQISRKGHDLRAAGPDFTAADLNLLTDAATVLAHLLPSLIEAANRVQ